MGLLTNFKQNDVFRDEKSLAFDGTNDYVETSFVPDYISTNATIAFWVKMNDFNSGQYMGIHNEKRWYFGFSGTDGIIGVANSFKDDITITPTPIVGQWIHYCCTAIDGTATLYINGVAQGTDSYAQSSGTDPNTGFFIGARDNSGAGNYMNGNISEVAQYNVGLTANQVKTIYNGREPYNHKEGVASGNLQAWYRMGDATDFAKDYGFIIPDQMSRGINTIKSWDFSSDVDGWTGYSGNTLEHSTAITNHLGGSGVVKCINADNGDKFIGGRSSALTDSDPGIEADKHYLIEYYLYVPSSWSGTTNIRLQEASMSGKNYASDVVLIDYSVKDSWQYGSNIFSPTSGDLGGFIYLQAIATTNFEADDFVYLSGVTLKEIDSKNGKMTNMDITDIEGDTP